MGYHGKTSNDQKFECFSACHFYPMEDHRKEYSGLCMQGPLFDRAEWADGAPALCSCTIANTARELHGVLRTHTVFAVLQD